MSEAINKIGREMVSVVTPTFRRPHEVARLLENLSRQTLKPHELLLIDGAPAEELETEKIVAQMAASLPFPCRYIRHQRGTAIQRNAGIDAATGNYIAFIDDDVRLAANFLSTIIAAFREDADQSIGGIVGYRRNQFFDARKSLRWRWYRRLKLLTTFEPGRYDFQSGYPINANLQPPFSGLRQVDFMTTACAVWRRAVFDSGLRFSPFFCDYGILEDAHLSLKASRRWQLLQCGDAHCEEMHSPSGRVDRKSIGYKVVVNYYYVFRDIMQPLTRRQKIRFWRFQVFELLRIASSAVRHCRRSDLMELHGRIEGMLAVARGSALN